MSSRRSTRRRWRARSAPTPVGWAAWHRSWRRRGWRPRRGPHHHRQRHRRRHPRTGCWAARTGHLRSDAERRTRRLRHIAVSRRKQGALVVNRGHCARSPTGRRRCSRSASSGWRGAFDKGDVVEIRDGSGGGRCTAAAWSTTTPAHAASCRPPQRRDRCLARLPGVRCPGDARPPGHGSCLMSKTESTRPL